MKSAVPRTTRIADTISAYSGPASATTTAVISGPLMKESSTITESSA